MNLSFTGLPKRVSPEDPYKSTGGKEQLARDEKEQDTRAHVSYTAHQRSHDP